MPNSNSDPSYLPPPSPPAGTWGTGHCAAALCKAGDEIVAAARFWAKTGIFSWGPFRLVCQLGVWNFYDN